jgi:hypothetical protein
MAVGRGTSSFQQLIGDFGESADYHDRLTAKPALHNADESPDSIGIFHRGTSELHHHHVVAFIESALSL